MLQRNSIGDLLSRYYSGEISTCKFCGEQGVIVAGDATRKGELELAQHEYRLLPYGVQVSKTAVCFECKKKMWENNNAYYFSWNASR